MTGFEGGQVASLLGWKERVDGKIGRVGLQSKSREGPFVRVKSGGVPVQSSEGSGAGGRSGSASSHCKSVLSRKGDFKSSLFSSCCR